MTRSEKKHHRISGDWAGETFIESLGTSTVALFFLAVALYAILLLPNTLAVLNQFWLFKYVRALSFACSPASETNAIFLY